MVCGTLEIVRLKTQHQGFLRYFLIGKHLEIIFAEHEVAEIKSHTAKSIWLHTYLLGGHIQINFTILLP